MSIKRFVWILMMADLSLSFGLVGSDLSLASPTRDFFFEGETQASSFSWQQDSAGRFYPDLQETRLLSETGKPTLLVQDLILLVPLNTSIGTIEVVPLATRRTELPGDLQLGQNILSDEGVPVVVDRYPLGDVFPGQWGEYAGSHTWRGYRLVAVRLFPVRLQDRQDDGWGEAEILERFALRIQPGSAVPTPDLALRQRRVPHERQRMENLLRGRIANPEALVGYGRQDGVVVPETARDFLPSRTPSLSGSPVSYLIITSCDLEPAFQELADHKTDQGLPAVVATVDWIEANFRHGCDVQETIRLFIREAYEKWGTEYVLLGGDTEVLPARFATSTYYPPGGSTDLPVDLYFACLDGNWNADGDHVFGEPYTSGLYPGDDADLAEEVHLGRAPVRTPAEAATFVQKVMSYTEVAPFSPWTNRNLFTAEVLFPPSWNPGDPLILDGSDIIEEIIEDLLEPCTTMEYTRMYENWPAHPGSVPLNRQALIDTLNGGNHGIFDHIGQGFIYNMSVGDVDFTTVDADALVNGDRLFVMNQLSGGTGAFQHDCLLEHFLRNPNGGAVATVGLTVPSFPHTLSEFRYEFYDQLYCQDPFRLGELMTACRLPFLPSSYYNTVTRWTLLSYLMLGDPAQAVWTDAPELVWVEAPLALVAGEQTVEITVRAGSIPIAPPFEGALVCLRKEGEDYATGVTGVDGTVNLSFTPTSAGDATLTITGPDLMYSQQTIPVTTGTAYVSVAELTFVDDGSDGSTGNGNGAPEAGETLALYILCRDTGGGGAFGCSAQLVSLEPEDPILVGTAAVGDVPPGGQKMSETPFLLRFDPGTADGHGHDFRVVVTDAVDSSFASDLVVTVLAPEVEPVGLDWVDAGNENGVIEDGERVEVVISLKNFGVGMADTVLGKLRTLDPEVTLLDTVVQYTDLALLEVSPGGAVFAFSDSDASSAAACWVHFTDNHDRAFDHHIVLDPPAAPAGLVTDSTLGPDVIGLHWQANGEEDLRGYHVYRSESPTGPFERADQDLCELISYFRDDDLDLLTSYYYRITAVDSSLTEGPPSDPVAVSTPPSAQSGFPVPHAEETSGHCAVGDVDGDGELEIVLGSDEIYVFNADGTELVDGDNDPATIGPITDLDGSFGPAGITLAELDGLPGLEIIASEREQRMIYVSRGDGTMLPGWPQQLRQVVNGWNWATPAVGDVDGDGGLDIVVNTLDGRTWAWHADGTELRDGDNDPATNGVFVVRPGWEQEWGLGSPALFDLDGDGAKEIIFGTNYGSGQLNFLLALRYDGLPPAGWPVDVGYGSVLCSPTVADLNRDGLWELIVVTENDLLQVVQQDGTHYTGFPIPFTSNNQVTPSPAVGNFDADDDLEIAAVSTVAPAEAYLYLIDTDGDGGTSGLPLPGWPVPLPGNSEASPVTGDIDGDGICDVLHGIGGGFEDSPNHLYAFNASGDPVGGFPIAFLGSVRTSAVICDLDADGDVDIVQSAWDRLLHVYDLPYVYQADRVPWPTFRGHHLRDGVHRLPVVSDTPDLALGLEAFAVDPAYPNPFNPTTNIKLFVPGEAGTYPFLQVRIFNLQGRLVRSLYDGPTPAGWRTVVWNGRDDTGRALASGVYFLRAEMDRQSFVVKLALVK